MLAEEELGGKTLNSCREEGRTSLSAFLTPRRACFRHLPFGIIRSTVTLFRWNSVLAICQKKVRYLRDGFRSLHTKSVESWMNDDTRSDGELLAAYVERNDATAFEAIYERYAKLVYSVCLRNLRVPQDAEDASAACFVVLHNKCGTIRDRSKLMNWLYTCAVATARNVRRSLAKRAERDQEAYIAQNDGTDSAWDRVLPVMETEIAALPGDQRETVILHFYQGLSRPELAERLGCSEGAVANRLHRAMQRLRRRLAAHGRGITEEAIVSGMAGTALLLPVPRGLALKTAAIIKGELTGGPAVESADATMRGLLAAKIKTAAAIAASVVIAGGMAVAVAQVAAGGASSPGAAPGPATANAVSSAAPVGDGVPAPANAFKGMQEREEIFAFAKKPSVRSVGSVRYEIAFETTARCDATVSILDRDGKIIRHLASGVLGGNAPHPFQQDSLSQKLEWDGLTDDFKKADAAGCLVKVSLGLQAQFDKSIAYDPYLLPPEGDSSSYLVPLRGQMLVGTDADGNYYIGTKTRCSVTVQVFGKDGKYKRTAFPPAAADVEKIMGAQGVKFGTTKWGDKVMISGKYGPFETTPGEPRSPPAGSKSFKDLLEAYPGLAAVIKAQPGVVEVKSVPRPKEIPAASVPGGGAVVGYKYLHISADRARDEVYAQTGGQLRFIGKTGELDKTWNPDPKKSVGGWECSVGPDGLFYFRWNAKMTRTDHEGKHTPFARENTVNVAGGQGWWTRVPGAFKDTGLDAVHCGHLMLSMTHQCGLHIAPSGLIAAGIQYPDFEWGQKMGVRWDTKDKAASFVVVFDREGKLVTGNAVGQTKNGTSVTMDRDGNIYALISAMLPAGQKTYEGCDVGIGANGGCSGLVKFRGLGGKYPLNVGPGTKTGKGEELPGAAWVYPGMPGAMAGCFCHQVRHDMDFWARSWIPANQMYSVMVLDANMNRIARIGLYGNVDDADPKCGKIHFAWLRAVAVSDIALYAADHGNRRILRAALSYAAEETVPVQ
ncbi:MAG: hypothetical protein C0404_01820 [Verrucomicrobia bacterium]|nr:hypothetical protein [Verrucomicrobiota bacterium]